MERRSNATTRSGADSRARVQLNDAASLPDYLEHDRAGRVCGGQSHTARIRPRCRGAASEGRPHKRHDNASHRDSGDDPGKYGGPRAPAQFAEDF